MTNRPRPADAGGARVALLVTLVGAAVGFAYGLTWDPFNLPKLAWLVTGATVAGGAFALRPTSVRLGALAVPLVALGLPVLIAWSFGPYRSWSLLGPYTFPTGLIPVLATMFFGLLCFVAFGRQLEPLMWTVAGTAAAVSGYAVVQWLGVDPLSWDEVYGPTVPGSSTFGNPNYSGGFLGVAAPVLIALWLASRGRRLFLTGGLAVLVAAGLLVTRAEAAWLGAGAGAAIALLWPSRQRYARALAVTVSGIAALVVIGAVVLAMYQPTIAAENTQLRDRGSFWIAAGGQFLDSPLVGRGPGSFAVEGIRYRPVADGVTNGHAFTIDPHSVPLSLLSGTGLIGLIGLLAALVWVMRRAALLQPGDVWGAGSLALVVAYLVQSLASTDQIVPRMLFWIGLAGLAAATTVTPKADSRQVSLDRVSGRLVMVPLSIALLSSVVYMVVNVVADQRIYRGVQAGRDLRRTDSLADLRQAAAWTGRYEYRRFLGSAMAQLAIEPGGNREELLSALRSVFGYTREFPEVESLREYAGALKGAANGDRGLLNEALTIYERAIAIDQTNPLLRVEAADILIDLDRAEGGYELLELFFFYFPRFPQYWGALALASAEMGEYELAEAHAASALRRDSRDLRALEAIALIREQEGN